MATAAQPSFQETLAKVAQHLEAPDAPSVAVACASLCIMISQQGGERASLEGLAAKLLEVLGRMDSVEVQRNAVAALSAVVEASDAALQEAVEAKAAQTLLALLQQQGAQGDTGLSANLLAALGALAEGSLVAAESVVEADGVEALLQHCTQQQGGEGTSTRLQEAAVDALCKLLGQGEDMRAAAAAKGVVPALAALLCATSDGEVRVRCLLALGMLAGGSPERQVQLADAPGAATQLVALMRQGGDADCQQIAGGLFGELVKNPAAKESIAAALKAGQQ